MIPCTFSKWLMLADYPTRIDRNDQNSFSYLPAVVANVAPTMSNAPKQLLYQMKLCCCKLFQFFGSGIQTTQFVEASVAHCGGDRVPKVTETFFSYHKGSTCWPNLFVDAAVQIEVRHSIHCRLEHLFGCISVIVISLGWAATLFQNASMVKCFALKWHILRNHPISTRVFPHVCLEHRVCLPATRTCTTYILFRPKFGWNHVMRQRCGSLTMLNPMVASVLNHIVEPMTLHCWS